MLTNAPTEKLPFSEQRQGAILGHLLTNERFFKQCAETIEPSWFADPNAGKIWAIKKRRYKKYGHSATIEEIKEDIDYKSEHQGVKVRLAILIENCQNLTLVYRLETLIEELTLWLHSRYFHEGFHQSEDLWNKGEFDRAISTMETQLKLIRTRTFENDLQFNFENYVAFFSRRQAEVSNALTFGCSAMDRLLLPQANGLGSMLRGDTTLLLAPTNLGKTTSMISIAASNIYRRQAVLFLTHEGVDDDIVEKIWCSMMNKNKAQLQDMILSGTEGEHQLFRQVLQWIKQYLVYVPLNRAGLTVEEVASVIRRKQEERIALTGKGFDLLIDDYPAKLKSGELSSGMFQKRNLDDYVYDYFVQLALEYKFHCVCAIQANRTAAKINKRQKGFEERLLVPEDANEAYGPCQTATNIITINRDALSEHLGYTTYYIGKTRSSEKGWAVVCKSNFGNAITHSDKLGATWYRGTMPLGDQIEEVFKKNVGQEVRRQMPA